MIRSYEARLNRLISPSRELRTQIRRDKYGAVDDSDAVVAAKALHVDDYDPSIDQIVVFELIPAGSIRLVTSIEGPLDRGLFDA